VGSDASGLELRCLAHYMHSGDGGKYVKVLLEGDVHTGKPKRLLDYLPEITLRHLFMVSFKTLEELKDIEFRGNLNG
jgi:MOSC domain-containing protein YiiM